MAGRPRSEISIAMVTFMPCGGEGEGEDMRNDLMGSDWVPWKTRQIFK